MSGLALWKDTCCAIVLQASGWFAADRIVRRPELESLLRRVRLSVWRPPRTAWATCARIPLVRSDIAAGAGADGRHHCRAHVSIRIACQNHGARLTECKRAWGEGLVGLLLIVHVAKPIGPHWHTLEEIDSSRMQT